MRALRINDFSMSPPKLRQKRESLYDAKDLDPDIKLGTQGKPEDAPAILHGKSQSGNNEHQKHI